MAILAQNPKKSAPNELKPRSLKALTKNNKKLTSSFENKRISMANQRATNSVIFSLFRSWTDH